MTELHGSVFPDKGDELIFVGVPKFFYPGFTDMREYANKVLHVGQKYIVRHSEIYSSWCAVWLERIEGNIRDGWDFSWFNLSFFKYAVEDTKTEEREEKAESHS